MAEPLTQFQETGVFSQIRQQPSLFQIPGSVRAVALIGEGKATKTILEEALTRDDSASNVTETLANSVASITRAFSESVLQYPQSSYGMSMTGSVTEGSGYNVNGLTFKIKLDGVEQTHTFTGGDPVSLADVVTELDAVLTGMDAIAAGTFLKILSGSATVGDGGSKLEITDGTANAVLGFTEGQVAQDLDWTASFASSDPLVRPLDTEAYLLDYETPKTAADLKPKAFFGLGQFSAEYGDPSASNTLSLGAQAAFGNGASIVFGRQMDPDNVATDSAVKAEVSASLADYERERVSILVPMVPINTASQSDSIAALMMDHVSKMSQKRERKERTAILGVDETSARLTILGVYPAWEGLMATFAGASGAQEPKRIMVMNPGRAVTTTQGVQFAANGTYLAAGMAGLRVSPAFDEATSMTKKSMSTVDELIVPELLRTELNTITTFGVTIMELNGALVQCRRSRSADATSIVNEEPSITDAFDKVASDLRRSLENRFIGTKILPGSTKTAVEGATARFLERFVAELIIADFRNVRAEPNAIEPRQVDITFEAIPIFPFLWGSIDISINIS